MVRLRTLLVDDKAGTENYNLEDRLIEALSRIDSRIELDWQEPVIEFSLAKRALSDPTMRYDLVFIDALWPRWDQQDTPDQVVELIRVVREHQEALVVLISRDDKELFTNWYTEDESCRPHAILSKSAIPNARIVRTMLEMGFSAIRKPLRSSTIEFSWERANDWTRLPDRMIQLAAEELLAKVQPNCTSAKLRPIGGGLSGAATILAEASYSKDCETLRAGFLLKLDSDARNVDAEQEAHSELVPSWPAATFAGLRGAYSYAGFSGIAFSQVWADTAESRLNRFLVRSTWRRLFSLSIARAQASSAERYDSSLGGVLRQGALQGDRLRRFARASRDLGLQAREIERSTRLLTALDGSIGNVRTVQHCDLHTRNVLITNENAIALIDAASMQSRELWCSDLARFSVWTALGLLESQQGSVDDLLHATADEILTLPQAAPRWATRLRELVQMSLGQFAAEYERRSLSVDRQRDWPCAVTCELMRAVYSADWFERDTRRVAARGAVQLAKAVIDSLP